jgi:hypothetical protein
VKRTTARTLYLVLGILLSVGAALFALATAAFFTSPRGTYTTDIQVGAGVCAGIQAVPAVILFYFWRATSRKVQQMDTLLAILRSVREVAADDVAKQIHRTTSETELMISQAISEGSVRGYLDPTEHRFISTWSGMGVAAPPPVIMPSSAVSGAPVFPPTAGTGTPEVRYCRECGHPAERIPGRNTWQCSNCGNIQ